MTTAAPVTFGAFSVAENVDYMETLINVNTAATIGTTVGAAVNFNLAIANMPWAGTFTCTLWHQGYFNAGSAAIHVRPYGTAPTEAYAGSGCDFCHSLAYNIVPYVGQWRDLAAGASVNLGVRIEYDAGNQVWQSTATWGTLRMFRI